MIELCGGKDAQHGVHAVVTEAADLRAEDGVVAGGGRREVDVAGLAGDGVLFQAHLGDGESVDDIQGAEGEVDFAVRGEDEFGGDDVVGAVRVGGVEADGVALAGGDELGAGAAEGGVGAGVAEVPGELHAGDLDLKGGGRGSGVAGGCPETLGFDGEGGKEDSEDGQREVFDSPEVFGFGGAAGEEADEEEKVREAQEGEGYPQIEEEVVIQCWAVRAGIGGKQPWEKRGSPPMKDGGHSSG